MKLIKIAATILLSFLFFSNISAQRPDMYFIDSSRTGKPMAKDPNVIFFKGQYFMYYSIPPGDESHPGWGIGIATSKDLTHWQKQAEMAPAAAYEKNGLCAPGALVKDGTLHLFYQTYGNGKKDAICHATSDNGIDFVRDATNPIFNPTGDWNCGRAIDAEVVEFKGSVFFVLRKPRYILSIPVSGRCHHFTQLNISSK